MITFSPYLCHTEPIFKDLNLLPISKLVTQRIAHLIFKYSIPSLPIVIEDLFTSNTSVSNHNTRNKSKLRQPRSNCEYKIKIKNIYRIYMYRNTSFSGVYIWTNILDHISMLTLQKKNITYTVFLYDVIV